MKSPIRIPNLAQVLACACLIAGSVSAEPAPSPAAKAGGSNTVGEVVVQGRSPQTQKAFEKAVERFLHVMGRPGPFGQIGRWAEPVCPISAGLTPAMDEFVDKRIREIAARVGAPGPGHCRDGENVMVIFTTEPDQLMADVRKHHEGLLGYHYVGETKALAAFEPPMKSWYITSTSVTGGDFVMLDRAYAPGPPQGGSHIPPPLQSRFAFVLVVVDAKLLEGQEIGPVADMVAMLALSHPAAREGCSPLESVMDYLDPACPRHGEVEGLSSYDEAYLKALYAYKGSELRYFERRSMAKRFLKDTTPPSSGSVGK